MMTIKALAVGAVVVFCQAMVVIMTSIMQKSQVRVVVLVMQERVGGS
jgi:hypothetical protein